MLRGNWYCKKKLKQKNLASYSERTIIYIYHVVNNSLPCVTVNLNAISWLVCGAVVNTGTGLHCDALSFTVRHHPL